MSVRGLPDMMSASEGKGGSWKADIVRKVSTVDEGGGGKKI